MGLIQLTGQTSDGLVLPWWPSHTAPVAACLKFIMGTGVSNHSGYLKCILLLTFFTETFKCVEFPGVKNPRANVMANTVQSHCLYRCDGASSMKLFQLKSLLTLNHPNTQDEHSCFACGMNAVYYCEQPSLPGFRTHLSSL